MIKIYTDGAYSSNRNQQGFAFVVYEQFDNIWIKTELSYGGLLGGTNNRAEMHACLLALQYIKNKNITKEVVIYSDSMYVIGTLTKNWKMNKNTDLWPKLHTLMGNNIIIEHIKGHGDSIENKLCDVWAVFGSQLENVEEDKY